MVGMLDALRTGYVISTLSNAIINLLATRGTPGASTLKTPQDKQKKSRNSPPPPVGHVETHPQPESLIPSALPNEGHSAIQTPTNQNSALAHNTKYSSNTGY